MRPMVTSRALPLALALSSGVTLLGGCGDTPEPDPATFLAPGTLRFLAARAEPAEPAAGETVTLSALIVDRNAMARPDDVTVEWRRCTLGVNAASTSAINQDCVTGGPNAPWLLPLGSGLDLTITMPDLDREFTGLPDATGGYYAVIRATARARDGRVVEGIYRLRYHTARLGPLPRNQNPKFAGMWFLAPGADRDMGLHPAVPPGDTGIPDASAGVPDGSREMSAGEPFVTSDAEAWVLRPLFADGSIETYYVATRGLDGGIELGDSGIQLGEKTEQLSILWFASATNIEQPVTGVDYPDSRLLFDKRAPTRGDTVDVIVLGRDDRGGTSWLHRQITYR